MTDTPSEPQPPADAPREGSAPPPSALDAPAPAPRPRLTRSSDRMIAGVAGGLAAYLGVDPVIVRVAFVALAVFGGTGVLAYLVAAVLMPAPDGSEPAPDAARRPTPPNGLAIAALLVVGVILAARVDAEGPGVLWAIVLLGLGALLFRQDTRAAGERVAHPVVPATGSSVASTYDTSYDAAYADLWDIPEGPIPAQPEPAPRRRSVLGRVTIAMTLLALGLVALVDNIGVSQLHPGQYFAMALVGVGAGLVVGAWRGRARGLIVLGALLVPLTLGASFAQTVPSAGGFGERHHQPETVSELREYELRVGQMTVDLTDLDYRQAVEVEATLGVGQLNVVVPDDARVAVTGQIRAGQVNVLGERQAFDDPTTDNPFGVPASGAETDPLLTVDLVVGYGEVNVVRDADAPDRPQLRGPFRGFDEEF